MSRDELEQRLRRAVEVRRALRRATNRLMTFGEALLRSREAAPKPDGAEALHQRLDQDYMGVEAGVLSQEIQDHDICGRFASVR